MCQYRDLSYAHTEMSFSLFKIVAVINAQGILLIAHTSRYCQKQPILYKQRETILDPNIDKFQNQMLFYSNSWLYTSWDWTLSWVDSTIV